MRHLPPALLLALALSACSGSSDEGGDDPTIALPTTTVSPTVVPTTPAPTQTQAPTQAPTATTAPVNKAADGDVDGDGEPDAVRATTDLITVTLSGSGKKVTAPVHADSPAAPQVLGSTDVDLDGRAEVFLRTVQGASTTFATPYRFDGTTLHELQRDGSPAVLGFGGSTQHGDGFRCTPDGRVEVRKAEADASGSSYTVETTVLRVTATDLVTVSTRTVTAKEGSPEVQAAYAVDCGSVGEGG